jgi:hypothetical protein
MYLLSSVGLLSSAVNAWTPPARPALWPAAFRVAITTNITFSPEPGAPPPLTAHPIAGVMYYDWAASASQAVEHGAGNYECSHFYGTYGPCRLVFNPQGLFADAPGAASGDACCLDLPAITASPPDWAARSNATLVSAAGPVIEPTSGALCHHWKWDWGEAGPCHHYWERASDGLPVLFTFPGGANGTQDWHFDLSTFAAGAQDPARFALAPACFHNCTPHAAGRRSSRSSSSSSTPMTMTAAATAAAAAAHRRAAADATWESYKQQFNKVYPVGGAEEEEEEEARRRGIFERNLLSYAALNAREPLARYGPTALSDRAPAEYLGGYRPPSSPAALSSPQPRDAELLGDASRQVPASADWTGRYTSPVKDQGSCGACWADSAIEQVESDAMRQHNWSGVLSTQELVDCTNAGQGSWRAGCGGGNPTDGYDVLQALGGAASGYEYTYRGRDSRCAVDNFTKYVTVTSYASVGARNETEMRSYVGSTGPLSVCVDASDWGGYSGGIKTTCGTSTDHCVQVRAYLEVLSPSSAYSRLTPLLVSHIRFSTCAACRLRHGPGRGVLEGAQLLGRRVGRGGVHQAEDRRRRRGRALQRRRRPDRHLHVRPARPGPRPLPVGRLQRQPGGLAELRRRPVLALRAEFLLHRRRARGTGVEPLRVGPHHGLRRQQGALRPGRMLRLRRRNRTGGAAAPDAGTAAAHLRRQAGELGELGGRFVLRVPVEQLLHPGGQAGPVVGPGLGPHLRLRGQERHLGADGVLRLRWRFQHYGSRRRRGFGKGNVIRFPVPFPVLLRLPSALFLYIP